MNYRFFQLLVFCLLLSLLSCENDEEEIQLTDQDLLENTIIDFEARTGIRIFYEPGDSELQNQLEIDHAVDDDDYANVPYSHLYSDITKLMRVIDDFPVEFIEDLELDAILVIDTNPPRWLGHATKRRYSSVAFDGLNYLKNKTLVAHELFHIFDPGLPIINATSEYETSWSALNPPGFAYGDGCVITSGLNSSPSTGFINDYSRCKPFEDRAIVFSFLYAKYGQLQLLRESDSFLDGKAEFIEDYLSDYSFDF